MLLLLQMLLHMRLQMLLLIISLEHMVDLMLV